MDDQIPGGRTPHISIVLALVVAGACRAVTPIGALAGDGQAPDSAVDSARAPDGDTRGSGGIDTRLVPEPDAAVDLPPPATDGPRALGPCEGGRLQWVRGTRSSGPVISRVNVLSTAVSPDGTVWVTGDFFGTVTFWAGQPGETTRSTSPPDFTGRELFLLKISPDGALLKFITVTHGCGGTSQPGGTEGRGVAALADGSVLLMGNFTKEVTLGTTTLNARGSQAMFLARYRADGSPLWLAGATGSEPSPGISGCTPAEAMRCDGGCGTSGSGIRLVALPDGRSRVLGSAGGGTTFRGTTDTTTNTRNTGGAYAAAYAPDGAHEWARLVGGTQPGEATMSADGSTFHTIAALLTRISSDGTVLWTKGPGAPGNPVSLGSVVAFSDGSTITSGGLNGTIVFGAGEPRETTLTVPHSLAYLASYQGDGSLAWVRLLSADFDRGNGSWGGGRLAAFPTGGFALAGTGSGAFRVDLSGWGACGGVVTGRAGESALLLARFDSSRSIMWSKIEGITKGGEMATAADGSTVIASYNWTETVTLGRGEPNETTLPAAEQFHNNAFVAKFGP
jgi:hypothetical protein